MVRYRIRSGKLFTIDNERPVCLDVLKSSLFDSKKTVQSPDGKVALTTEIQTVGQSDRLQDRRYMMMAPDGNVVATGIPCYDDCETSVDAGWSIHLSTKVDHVRIKMRGSDFCLYMLNSQNYRLVDTKGQPVFELIQNGLQGGWSVESDEEFESWVLLGLFIFCRYLERENEYSIV